MRETTLFEVMAEVGGVARSLEAHGEERWRHTEALIIHAETAWRGEGREVREALLGAAAHAILALHAHDAEAAASAYNPGPEGA